MKFVHNGRHDVTSTAEASENFQELGSRSTGQWTSIVNLRSRKESHGASYGLMRLVPPPRSVPTTVADRVSARWVAQFDMNPVRDLLKTVGYTTLLPLRVVESPALRDVVALFCSAWSNFKRGKTEDGLIEMKTYAKAIRSMRRAIEDQVEFSSGETLAATILLERFEALFDKERSYHRCIHGRGVYSLLARRGPPKLTDEFDVCLALEGQATVVSTLIPRIIQRQAY